MMITEYITNGNLSDVLHQDNSPIPLDVRLRIAIECAEALAYMHSHMYTRVIHGDIKPSNILLDDNFHAKLSDFGISRLVNTDKVLYMENVIGSIGYMDPLFAQDGLLTSKSDVYSFGVVLLELIARKKATTVMDNVNIVRAFTNALARGVRGAREMFDGEIASKNSMKIVEGFAKIAGECLAMERNKRPEMIDVVERLRVLKKTSHQDLGERAGLFSWARKSKPVPAAGVTTVPAKILVLPAHLCRQFSFAEMKAATNNFHWRLIVGEGAFGRVYRGKIDGGKTKVAIKRHSPNSRQGEHEFRTEIEMSSKVRHCNVAQLIGYCDEMGEMILVYEYMPRGCLRNHLYRPPLTWNRRLEICIGAARGLHCLHASQVIYRNLRTEDILLDHAWVAKLTDLALCKTAGPSMDEITRVIGSGCLLDHEYVTTGRLTEKLDVYSFGGVLLQVLCARPILDISLLNEEGSTLVDWALHCKQECRLDQIVDPYLKGSIDQSSLETFVGIAEKCLASEGVRRPSMGDVLLDLELALRQQGTTTHGLSPVVL
ncbi:hypothetical protein BDA96_01G377700 [Sorghum bicolor]|uniref:Protein kinase domain-containing protein n=1 Tax=Sorghum bicolor TaxID=4558 RepID=A0A921V048_SORBI|nr:hypothetical protein BDA96_01G377700 [Sorghum bicolor]